MHGLLPTINQNRASQYLPMILHIKPSLPRLSWWEARVSYPGYDTHGYYMGAMPFPIMGDTKESSWGVTIFHKDSTNFIKEELVDEKHLRNEKSYKISAETVKLKVKGEKDFKFTRYSSDLGPPSKRRF